MPDAEEEPLHLAQGLALPPGPSYTLGQQTPASKLPRKRETFDKKHNLWKIKEILLILKNSS